jgi:hypothetical protein
MVKFPDDYLRRIEEQYPEIPRKVLRKIVTSGLKSMQHLIYADLDVRIGNDTPGRTYKLTITRPLATWDEVMQRAKNKFYQLKRRRSDVGNS